MAPAILQFVVSLAFHCKLMRWLLCVSLFLLVAFIYGFLKYDVASQEEKQPIMFSANKLNFSIQKWKG